MKEGNNRAAAQAVMRDMTIDSSLGYSARQKAERSSQVAEQIMVPGQEYSPGPLV